MIDSIETARQRAVGLIIPSAGGAYLLHTGSRLAAGILFGSALNDVAWLLGAAAGECVWRFGLWRAGRAARKAER